MASYRQNRPVLFLKGPYNILLQLVHACSIFQGTMQHPSHNQYRFVLSLKEPCNTLLTFSTGLFYFSTDHTHTFLQLVHACSISQETMLMPSQNQYRPVLFLKGPYNIPLQLVQACSISQRAMQHPSYNQYRPVLSHKRP